jgi:hypothetical protein
LDYFDPDSSIISFAVDAFRFDSIDSSMVNQIGDGTGLLAASTEILESGKKIRRFIVTSAGFDILYIRLNKTSQYV